MLRALASGLLAGGLVLVALTGCAADRAGPAPATLTKRAVPSGESYQRYCALCHGERGQGAVADHANALTNEAFLATVTDDFLVQSIRRGRPGTPMSAFSDVGGGPLDDAEILEIVRFIRTFQRGPAGKVGGRRMFPDPARAERARPLFAAHCASCHGDRGEGRLAPSLDNPVFNELATDQLLLGAIFGGRPGTTMPAFGGVLSGTEIADLVHLIRSLAPPLTATITTRPGAREGWATREDIPVVLNPEGAAPHFAPANAYVRAEQVQFALDDGRRMVLLDARPASDWRAGHIPGALPAPFYDDAEALRRVPNDGTQIVVYCGCPHVAADRLASRLRAMGHTRVAVIEEGLYFWRDQGYPLVSEPDDPIEEVPPEPTVPSLDQGVAVPDSGAAEEAAL